MTLREEISHIVGFAIPEGKWDSMFSRLGTEGRIDIRTLIRIVLVLIKHIEAQEKGK